jgi:hypothetical protein
MEAVTHRRHSGNRGPLASGRLSDVLEVDLESEKADREKTDTEGGAGVDLPPGGGEPHLGSTPHPWRASPAGFRSLGTNHLPVGNTSATGSRARKALAAFLRNHREAIAAMDFFTVPTITFGVLYCLFVISHERRKILHFNITRHPISTWIVQQLREAFPYQSVPRFLIFDRDAKYGIEVPVAVRSMAMTPVRTSVQSPWQNGVAERWIESCRRDLLDHVIAVSEHHLKRLLSKYAAYYHEDRTHLALGKETPNRRAGSLSRGGVIARARLGGLYHRYDRAA